MNVVPNRTAVVDSDWRFDRCWMFHISSLGYLCFYTIRTLSRTVPRDPPTPTTPPILIGRLHSYDFRSNCIVNHDLTLSSRLHVIQHFETICTNWYYHKPTRFRQPNNRKSKYPQQNQSSFAFAVKYLVLPWGFCFCREVFGFAVRYFVFALRRWRAKVALWQDICLLFVLSQCDFCPPARRSCSTWMSSCKGPIGCVRAGTVGRQVMSQIRRCADAQNCAVRYSADERFVRPHGSMLWYYPFVWNCSACYITKCSEPKEFYLSLHFCVFLVLFRLLARTRTTRPWTTHFSHLVTLRESTLRTRVAPMMFVFLLEKE